MRPATTLTLGLLLLVILVAGVVSLRLIKTREGRDMVPAVELLLSSLREAMREGRCGIGEMDIRDLDRLSIRIAGQVRNYDPEERFNRQQLSLYDRFTQFTLIAAREAGHPVEHLAQVLDAPLRGLRFLARLAQPVLVADLGEELARHLHRPPLARTRFYDLGHIFP